MTERSKIATIEHTMAVLAVNRKAPFDYEILETYEAGIQLYGFEVKSVKTGHINLAGSFAVIRGGEAWLVNATIPPYQAKNTPPEYDPTRSRKLLLHRRELKGLTGKLAQKGLTFVPLRIYTKNSTIKVAVGLARRRKKYDKREVIKKRDIEKEVRRTL